MLTYSVPLFGDGDDLWLLTTIYLNRVSAVRGSVLNLPPLVVNSASMERRFSLELLRLERTFSELAYCFGEEQLFPLEPRLDS